MVHGPLYIGYIYIYIYIYIYVYVVHLVVCIINCTKCMVLTSKWKKNLTHCLTTFKIWACGSEEHYTVCFICLFLSTFAAVYLSEMNTAWIMFIQRILIQNGCIGSLCYLTAIGCHYLLAHFFYSRSALSKMLVWGRVVAGSDTQ